MADLARGVRALERRQVDHRHREADALLLGRGLDRPLAELGGALLDPDSIDVGQTTDHDARLLRSRTVKRVLVFCGSSPGRSPEYVESATDLGRLLASRGPRASSTEGRRVGLMGALADARSPPGAR